MAAPALAFPLLGSGDIRFRFDHAAFRSGTGGAESEFYLEIDNSELEFVVDSGDLIAEVELKVDLFAEGKRVFRREYPLKFTEGQAAPDAAVPAAVAAKTQVLHLRIPVPDETDSVHAEVEDQNARKRGLVYLFTKTRKAGEAGGRLNVRRFPPGELSVSDIQFAYPFGRETTDQTFMKSGIDVEPNPGRVYGAVERIVSAYFEVYDLARPTGGERRDYEIAYVVRDQAGEPVRDWSRRIMSQAPTWADTVSFDVSGLRPGTYFLGVSVKEEMSGGRAIVESSFDLVWAAAAWTRWLIETEAIVPFLIGGVELDSFLALGPGAKERYLEDFWAAHDATPGQGNATREEFNRRVAWANRNYSTTLEPGMRTDRGRIYIKYGEPDELRREVIPVQGNDINAALDELDRSTSGELTGNRAIDPEDSRAFEIWLYDYRGKELFPTKDMTTGLGLQFIFVDDLGVGDYRLIRTNDKSDF